MKIINIVSGVNTLLAGETLTLNQMRLFLDSTIDEINDKLSSKFPTFEGLTESNDYDFFPDNFIRSVVIKGTAYKFYVTDEEGIPTAVQYKFDYLDALFIMERDYSCKVPTEYQDYERGYVTSGETTAPYIQMGWRGW